MKRTNMPQTQSTKRRSWAKKTRKRVKTNLSCTACTAGTADGSCV